VFNSIKKLQSKSETTRRHVGLLITSVITAIIVLFWIFTLGDRISFVENVKDVPSSVGLSNQSDSPFDLIKKQVGTLYDGVE